jgi:hypothetical protein
LPDQYSGAVVSLCCYRAEKDGEICDSVAPMKLSFRVFCKEMLQKNIYITQNHWVYEPYPSSGILKTRKKVFRALELFPSSGEFRETPVLWDPVIVVRCV